MTVIGVAMVIGECGNLTLIFPIRCSRLPCETRAFRAADADADRGVLVDGPSHVAKGQGVIHLLLIAISPLSRGRRSFCSKSFQLADDQPAHSLFPPSRRKTTDMSVPQAAVLDAGVPAAALLAVLRAR